VTHICHYNTREIVFLRKNEFFPARLHFRVTPGDLWGNVGEKRPKLPAKGEGGVI